MQNKPPPVLPPSVGSTLPLGLIPSAQDRASSGCSVMKRRRRKREDPRLQTSPNQRRVLTRRLPRRVEDKRRRRGCSQQGGSRKPQLGGLRAGLQGQLCPRAAAHGCRPGGPCPPTMPRTPATALSLCQKATGPRRKTYKSTATGIFTSPVVFPRVFREPFEAAGCTAVSGCGQPLCLPRQCRHPAVLA